MKLGMSWAREDAEANIRRLLEAAREQGSQRIVDADGSSYEVTFRPRRKSLEELFSKPGPVTDD